MNFTKEDITFVPYGDHTKESPNYAVKAQKGGRVWWLHFNPATSQQRGPATTASSRWPMGNPEFWPLKPMGDEHWVEQGTIMQGGVGVSCKPPGKTAMTYEEKAHVLAIADRFGVPEHCKAPVWDLGIYADGNYNTY